MTLAVTDSLQVKGLGRHKMEVLARKAKRLGVTPGKYVKMLVEEDLAISEEARTKTFAEIMGPGREVDEEEVDRLVERAKARHHEKMTRKRK
ncbi:MAG TPA: hypothetical protein VGN88_08560 [Phycisphaerae bacterium]|jgi:hypothetical protein